MVLVPQLQLKVTEKYRDFKFLCFAVEQRVYRWSRNFDHPEKSRSLNSKKCNFYVLLLFIVHHAELLQFNGDVMMLVHRQCYDVMFNCSFFLWFDEYIQGKS